jgi:hypothetical protein
MQITLARIKFHLYNLATILRGNIFFLFQYEKGFLQILLLYYRGEDLDK